MDERGRLLGLHVIRELLNGIERPNAAVVMAGGRGARLAPLTPTLPKPMVRVAGRPLLERLVPHLAGAGIREVFLSVNYLAEVIEEHFGDGSAFGCRITHLRESTQLGKAPPGPCAPPAGDERRPGHNFSVVAMLADHAGRWAMATVAVREHSHEIAFGVAEVDDGRLLGLRECWSRRCSSASRRGPSSARWRTACAGRAGQRLAPRRRLAGHRPPRRPRAGPGTMSARPRRIEDQS